MTALTTNEKDELTADKFNGEAERVLVVDDDAAFRKMMMTHLTRKGYIVEDAAEGVQALFKLRKSPPGSYAVVVTDMMMPGMTGDEVVREARAYDPWLECIVITAAGSLENAITSMREHGAYDYLLKPLETTNELSLSVAKAADHRRLRLENDELRLQTRLEAEKLQAILESSQDVILAGDSQNQILAANWTAKQLLGYPDELIGRFAFTVLPKPLAKLLENWQVEGEGKPSSVELHFPEDSTQLVQLTPLQKHSENEGGGWIMVLRDITHLQRVEAYRLQLLYQSTQKLQKPLGQAFATLNALEEDLGEEEPYLTFTEQLMSQLEAIQAWKKDITEVGRLQAGIGLDMTVVNLSKLLQRAEPHLRKKIEANDLDHPIELQYEIQRVPLVHADLVLVFRLISEMVGYVSSGMPLGGTLKLALNYSRDQVWLRAVDMQAERRATAAAVLAAAKDTAHPSHAGDNFDPTYELLKGVVTQLRGQIWRLNHQRNSLAVSFPATFVPDVLSERSVR